MTIFNCVVKVTIIPLVSVFGVCPLSGSYNSIRLIRTVRRIVIVLRELDQLLLKQKSTVDSVYKVISGNTVRISAAVISHKNTCSIPQ
jgi:hypothetical protein